MDTSLNAMTGVAVSEGVSLGKIYIYDPYIPQIKEEKASSGGEREKFTAASAQISAELLKTKERLAASHPQQAKIFDAHAELLEDEDILTDIDAMLDEGWSACRAVERVYTSYIDILKASDSELIRQRCVDLSDVKNRLLRRLMGIAQPELSGFDEPVIIVSDELTPSDTAAMDTEHIVGIATRQGGLTSHVAILAKSLGIPAILGIANLTDRLKNGELALLDTEKSTLFTGDAQELTARYERLSTAWEQKRRRIEKFADAPCLTRDGEKIGIGANIGSDSDEELAGACRADYIGLFRSEFLYMRSEHMPTEEEQFAAYKKVLSAMAPRRVTIRTLDIGGDKSLPYLPQNSEMNPFLGLRALRLCLEKKDMFRTQLRALLRASTYGCLDIMFPMVSGLEEFRQAKQLVIELTEELRSEGIEAAENIGIGIMIETPSIALLADKAAAEVDFASVGTNDLCQYLTAADRGNPMVGRYYQSYHPSMFRLLGSIAEAFERAEKPLSICGELAGDSSAAPILVGLGIKKLSMSPTSAPAVKEAISKLSLSEMRREAKAVCDCATAEDVQRIIS